MEANILLNNRYKVLLSQKIGQGSFGQVYETEDLQCPKIKLATKVVKSCDVKENEIEAWRQIKGLYVVELLYHEQINDQYFFVMEKCNDGNLGDLIKAKEGKCLEDEVIKYARFIIDGYQQSLYQKNIVHRDLKPDNIVIQDGIPKIVDFGLTRILEDHNPVEFSITGTPQYSPPERMDRAQKCNYKFDIYSIGCIIYFCLYGQSPKNPKTEYQLREFYYLLQSNQKEAIPFPPRTINGQTQEVNPQIQELITNMIVFDPEKRLDLDSLKELPVFQQNQFLSKKGQSTFVLNRMQKILNAYVKELIKFEDPTLEKIPIQKNSHQSKAFLNQELIDKYFLFAINSTTFALLVLNQFVQYFYGMGEQRFHFDYFVLLFVRLVNLSFGYIEFTLKESCTQIPESLIKLKIAYQNYKISQRCKDTKTLLEKKQQQWSKLRDQLLNELSQNWKEHTEEQIFKSISTDQIKKVLREEEKRNKIEIGSNSFHTEAIPQSFLDIDSTYQLIQQMLAEFKKKFNQIFRIDSSTNATGLFLLLNFAIKQRTFNIQFETFNFSDIYHIISKEGDDIKQLNQILLSEFEKEFNQ